ncbi:MAG: hypothetical protein C0485_03395 [Pirellula sp.]|nr:hypothetical protein [Pirellula sp.]
MFLAHSIRLRDPWQCEATEQGGVRWSRRFHRPTGMEADDQLVLVLSGLPAGAMVRVNGLGFDTGGGRDSFATGGVGDLEAFPVAKESRPLTEQSVSAAVAAQFDLTAILRDANEIEIETPPDPLLVETRPPISFPYDARLAIIGHS